MPRKCQPGPRVIFSSSIPRSAERVLIQRFNTPKASPAETYPQAELSSIWAIDAELAHHAQEICRKPVAHRGARSRDAIQIRMETIVALLLKNQRQKLLFEVPLEIEMPLGIVRFHASNFRLPGSRAAASANSTRPYREIRTRPLVRTSMHRSTRARCSQRSP